MISMVRTLLLCMMAIAVVRSTEAVTPLTLGTTYAGSIAVPGQTNAFTFTGSPGQRIFVDALDSDSVPITVTLLTPGGVALSSQPHSYDQGPFLLSEPGTFTLVVSANSSTTGTYHFRVLDLATGSALPLGAVLTGQLSPPASCNVYDLNGKRGQRISFQWVSYTTNKFQWQLISPANAVIAQGQSYNNLAPIALPMDGTYALLVEGQDPVASPLIFQLSTSDVSDAPAVASGFGTVHSGNISANTTNSYTYTAPAGLPVYFDNLDTSGQSLVVDLLDPTGGVVFTVGEILDAGPYILPRSGSYTLNVRGYNGASGNYNFRLLDLSQSPALTLNSLISNSLASPYQTDIYQFSSTAGKQVFYETPGNPSSSVRASLLGPDGQFALSSVYNNQGPVTLSPAGTYYLIVQNQVSTGNSYSFALLDGTSAAPAPINSYLTGSLPVNALQLFQLSASQGQKFYFLGNPNPGGSYWALFDPRNNYISSSSLSGDFQVTIPYPANYLLVLSGNPSSVVNYSNLVSTISVTTNVLTLGTAISNNLVNPGDQLVYTFNGTAGQRLFYDALNPNYFSINAALYTPSGLYLFSGNASSDYGPVTLPETGTYTLNVSANGHTTGAVMFNLLDVAAQPTLPINTDLQGTLPIQGAQLFTHTATSGELLYFNAKYVSGGGAYWSLYGPNNAYVGSAGLGGDFTPTLAQNGTYVLVLQNSINTALTFSNQVNTFSITTNTLTLGTTVTNNLVQPGDQQIYTFSATAGQRIYIDSLTGLYNNTSMSLYSPLGTLLGNVNLAYDLGPLTLPVSGTYSLVVAGGGDTVGPVSLRILDVDAQASLPLNTDLVGTLPPNSALIYKLAGTAGEPLYFNAKGGVGNGATWILFAPNNAQLMGNGIQGDFQQTLPFTGNYTLVLSAGNNPPIYSNQVNTITYQTNSLTLGNGVFTTLAHPGDQFFYTFNGTAGQRLYYDSRQTNYVSISVSLISPAGATVFSGNSISDSGPFTLPQTGTYLLAFSGSGDAVGDLSFNLLDLASATAISPSTTISDALVDQTQTRLYKFSGTSGQRLNLQTLSTAVNAALWGLYGPADQIIGSQSYINGNIGIVTLPVTGTYTLAVIGSGSVPTAVPYQLSLADVSDSSVAATGFGIVNTGNIGANQTNSFSLTASAGTLVYFDSQDTSGQNLGVDLLAPDGTYVFYGAGETSDAGPYVLPRSGTYTLSVRGFSGASGNYSFRLLNLNSSPQLTLNSVTSGTLSNPFETDVYQFTTTAGQLLIYDALTNDVNYPSVFVSLLDPKFQTVGPGGDFQNDSSPFVVHYNGTCYLFLRNNRSAASGYAFQMLDPATQPVLPVNTSITNTVSGYADLVYHLNGAAGQKLYFQGLGQSANPSGYWSLYDPNGVTVLNGSASLTSDFEVVLPAPGLYTLLFSSYATTTATEIFRVNDFSYITNAYTIGATISDTIARPGERHVYTFVGTLGQQLYFDSLTNDPPVGYITATLYNPSGVQEGPINSRITYDRGPFTLSQSGTYTLVVDGAGSAVGPFAFRILDIAAQPALPINVGVTNTLDVYASPIYKLTGTAGQRFYFRGQVNNPSANWTLYDPNNLSLGSSGVTGDFELTLPLSGTYALVIASYSSTTAPLIFQVNDYQYFTNAYTLGTAVFDAINRPGERRYYTFTGTRGQRLVYNSLTNDPPYPNTIYAQLVNPDGGTELNNRFSYNPPPFTLQETGTYTLILDGQNSGVGAFAFQLLDVSAQPALPTTGGVTNTLGVFAAEVYQYSGLAGEHLYFRGFSGNPNGYWSLYDPNNAQVAGNTPRADMDVTLPVTGTYVLLIQSSDTAPGTETFQVNPFNYLETTVFNRAPVLNHIPDQVLAAGVQVSFSAQATDPDNNALTFSLDPGSPAGASLDPLTGAFTWSPPITGLSSVTPVTIRVTDNGTPPLSAAQVVQIEVIAGPAMIAAQPSNSVVNVSWHSAPGKHYQIQYKNEIADSTWQQLGSSFTASALISVQVDTTAITNNHRFYRVQSLDPLP